VEADEEQQNWQQKGLALAGGAAVVLVAVIGGLYTILTSMQTPLHQNAADVPSVRQDPASPEWADEAEQWRQIARAGMVEWNLPGVSVAVGVGGELVWAEGFGWADVGKKLPVAPHMRFRIGHVSKALTSAAVGLLVEERRLDLDDVIQTYVPAYPHKEWPVRLRQLMGHTAGVRHYDGEDDYMPTAHCTRAADGVMLFADDPLQFQPETRYGYSTFGWILVSAAVEAVEKEPFFDVMRRRVFEPLGMTSTTTDSVTSSIPDLVTFYDPRLSGDPAFGPEVSSVVDYSCFAGAGAFLSTPSDLVRFGMAVNGGTFLKPSTVAMLQAPQPLLSGGETEYGLGWMLETFDRAGEPARVVGHGSRTMLGSSASFLTVPARGLAVAVMSNTSDAAVRQIALKLADALAAAPRPARP